MYHQIDYTWAQVSSFCMNPEEVSVACLLVTSSHFPWLIIWPHTNLYRFSRECVFNFEWRRGRAECGFPLLHAGRDRLQLRKHCSSSASEGWGWWAWPWLEGGTLGGNKRPIAGCNIQWAPSRGHHQGATWRQQHAVHSFSAPRTCLVDTSGSLLKSGCRVVPLFCSGGQTFRGHIAMEPLWTDTGAPVRHANTYSDVGDHVAFGVDPPCDRQFFPFPVACCLVGYWAAARLFPTHSASLLLQRSLRDCTAVPERRVKNGVGR